MFRRRVVVALAASALAGCGGSNATAPSSGSSPPVVQIIVELFFSNPVQTGPARLAQSVALPAGGAFNNIRFRWTPSNGAPPVTGALYIIDREYAGPLSELSTAPGLVARSIRIENGEYVFDAAVTLAGGSRYWFGADSNVGYVSSQRTTDIYPGGDLYFVGSLTGGPDSYVRAFIESQSERLDSSFTLSGARVQSSLTR
jgi:hypothetical protein